jgi:hypothetical protein
MSEDPYDFELVILGTESQGFPHLEVIQSANPGLIIHTEILPDPDDAAARQTAWRNCDRNLTNWWIDNRESVSKSRVLFLEWDTFANVDLRTIVPGDFRGIAGAFVKRLIGHRAWLGFRETESLPPAAQPFAIGIEPMACVMISADALDYLARPDLDGVYNGDILSELRTPTLLRAGGFDVIQVPEWANVQAARRPMPADFSGIFHPLKTEVQP